MTSQYPSKNSRFLISISLVFLFAVVYGSLFPFKGWHWNPSKAELFWSFDSLWPRYLTRNDVINNILVYIPLGFLLTTLLIRHTTIVRASLFAPLIAFAISMTLEIAQLMVPGRIASLLDVMLNSIGGILGVISAHMIHQQTRLGHNFSQLRLNFFYAGRVADVGLAILFFWALSELVPLYPSMDEQTLTRNLDLLKNSINHPHHFNFYEFFIFVLQIGALGLLFNTLMRSHHHIIRIFIVFTATVLLLQIPVISRDLSLEKLLGLFLGLALFLGAHHFRFQIQSNLAIGLIILSLIINAIAPGVIFESSSGFNWIPFRHQMHNIVGFADICTKIWPYAALAYFILMQKPTLQQNVIIGIATIIMLSSLMFEALSLFGSHKTADITTPLLATFGWMTPWIYVQRRRGY